jgi:hypothetical protein
MKKNGFIVVCATVALLLATTLLAGCTTTGANGETVYKTGNFEYQMFQLSDDVMITRYTGRSKVVKIPETIRGRPVTIMEKVFKGKGLTAITMPHSDDSIATETYADNQLTEITLPDSVTMIGHRSFANNQLTELTLPNSVSYISVEAFANNRLTELTLPDSVTKIMERAFANNQLTEITIPDGVTVIGDGAFANNRLRSVTIPNTVAHLGIDVFEGNNLSAPPLVPESDKPITVFSDKYNQFGNIITSISGQITGQGDSRTVTIAYLRGNNIVIPDMVYGIPVTRITNLLSSEQITDIRKASSGFREIENLTLPTGLIEISDDAFVGHTIRNITFPSNSVEELWNRMYPAMANKNLSLIREWEQAAQQKKNREFEADMERMQGIRRSMEQYRRNLGN